MRPDGGTGRRKGLKIPREQSHAGSTPALGRLCVRVYIAYFKVFFYMLSWLQIMINKKYYLILFTLFLSGCGKSLIPLPSMALPERNLSYVNDIDLGPYPENYQLLLKNYLIKNLINQETAKLDFINTPQKISISHLGSEFNGYRVCLSINTKNRKNIYTGYKTHLFLFKNDIIELHLYDSGLLKIPFELCVDRDEQKSIYIDDIPDINPEITIDKMDSPEVIKNKELLGTKKNPKYILCDVNSIERTFYFHENSNSLSESIGVKDKNFDNVVYSKTHISGSYKNEEVLINRVSGKIILSYGSKKPVSGECSLLKNRKF